MTNDGLKLDRLKEIASDEDILKFPSRHAAEYGEVMKALPGLLRVCEEHRKMLIYDTWPENDVTYEQSLEIYAKAEKKLEELLG